MLSLTIVFIGNADEVTELAILRRVTDINAKPITTVFEQITPWSMPSTLSLMSSRKLWQIID